MSALSLLGTVVYGLVVLACLHAAQKAGRHNISSIRRMVSTWLAGAGLFVMLIIARIFLLEDRLRDALRAFLREEGEYDDRWAIQLGASGIALCAAALIVVWWLRSWHKAAADPIRRSTLLAQCGIVGMIPLWGLRIASLHAVDRLLYSGPIRLNWIFDLGLSALVALSAVLFVRHLASMDAHFRARERRGRH